ncbi:hypothetical protein HDU93_002108 [Gonapodya sp. JEL0774]|nr:hypothetical protein HDU93_002108 [Gonapodya sp. JEL0774]
MSWDANDFSDIRPVADRHVMNLAGKPLKVMGVGTLLVTTVNEVVVPTSTLELTNSWYVPDLNVKVIAHCVFAAKGCAIRGESHDLESADLKGNSKVCGIERFEENGLYRIRGYPTHLGGSAKASSCIAGVSDCWALADGLREGGNLGENVDRFEEEFLDLALSRVDYAVLRDQKPATSSRRGGAGDYEENDDATYGQRTANPPKRKWGGAGIDDVFWDTAITQAHKKRAEASNKTGMSLQTKRSTKKVGGAGSSDDKDSRREREDDDVGHRDVYQGAKKPRNQPKGKGKVISKG